MEPGQGKDEVTEDDKDHQLLVKLRNLGGPGGTGPAATLPGGFRYGMRAFRARDFRIFFAGALASNTGNWLQNIAVPFVLFELTNRSIWVGLAAFAQFIPGFILGPIGGSLADRYDRRRVLIATQSAMAVSAFLLWAAWAAGWRDPALILALTALTGVCSGLMVPSWQALVPSLVDKADLPSAITLNSTQFNAARAVGPALAGVLLATAGPGLAFFLNGVSFVAVIGALTMIRPRSAETTATTATTTTDGDDSDGGTGESQSFRAGLQYASRRRGIVVSMLCAVLVAFFGNPVTQFTVVFADQVYGAGPRVLGILAAAVGTGAVLIAPALTIWDTTRSRSTVVRYGLPIYALAIIAFGLAPTWPLAVAALVVSGAGFLVVVASTNTAIQLIVADHMRGRVLSARVMGFTLAFPLGSLIQGALSDLIGPQITVVIAGGCLLAIALYLATARGLLDSLDRTDDTPDRLPLPAPGPTSG